MPGGKEIKPSEEYICSVCGDSATGYRFYGASSVCYSCRIFFRRTVSADEELTSCSRGTGQCSVDKSTRNNCKKCRYEKCLAVGLLPYLVNKHRRTSKNVKKQETKTDLALLPQLQDNVVPVKLVMLTNIVDQTTNYEREFEQEYVINSFESMFTKFYLEAMARKEFFDMEKDFIDQSRENRAVIKVSTDVMDMSLKFMEDFMEKVLAFFLQDPSSECLKALTENAALNLLGTAMGVVNCWTYDNLLDQYAKQCIFFPDPLTDYFKTHFPDIENLKPYKMESIEVFKSPYAKSFEEEDFVQKTQDTMQWFINGDITLAKLFLLLAIFTPVNIPVDEKEKKMLKHFQQKISIMIYNHLMTRSHLDNLECLQRMTQLVGMIEDLNRVGRIFAYGLIQCTDEIEDDSTDLDCIDVVEIS